MSLQVASRTGPSLTISALALPDINTHPIINPDNFDLARYYNDIYQRRCSVLFENYKKRLLDQAQELAKQEFSASADHPSAVQASVNKIPVAELSVPELDDKSQCAKEWAEQLLEHFWNFLVSTPETRTFAGIVTFFILSFFYRDIIWFVLYWLQVPLLGLNGPRLGWLYVPPRGTWENEVNTRRWRCTFYVFTDNYAWGTLLKRAFLLYLVVYPITHFLVPEKIVHHVSVTVVANVWFYWMVWLTLWVGGWALRVFGLGLWGFMKAFGTGLRDGRNMLFGMVWKKRYLCCLGLVLFLAWWPNRSGLEDPNRVCGIGPDDYDPGFFLTFAGLLYTLGDAARSVASSCFL
ncbi:hypothetical protein B0T21DRAFT_371393 [Apiosordaria backusii]|uniref:Uncharacterized protein n=1 Tax=Apiosordaria backusii TaxID=314023 RepID=A0AA40B288_9PEZI|nr:hypothetical protein B0T21DRAFT_371393 [Apiosordaria backusii]